MESAMPHSRGGVVEVERVSSSVDPSVIQQGFSLHAPGNAMSTSTVVSHSSNVSSLVAATPDVNVGDFQPRQTLPNAIHSRLSGNGEAGGGLRSHGVSGSDLVSFVEPRNSRSCADVSAVSAVSDDQPLPMLTAIPFSTVSSVNQSTGNNDNNGGAGVAGDGGGGRSGSSAATAAAGMAGSNSSPSVSLAGRSLTLLERRTNRERSAMSLSCLSGLNVEKLQEGMRDTSSTVNAREAPVAAPQGWSKTVASAALLSSYVMPALAGSPSGPAPPSATPSARPSTGQYHGHAQRPSGGPTATASAPTAVDTIPGAIKVVGYNILASRLASTDLYPTCAPSVLSEEYRLGLIKEELRRVNPDILLLEEISVAVHERALGPFLKVTLGMEGHHVVITDRDGTPRCAPLTPHSKTAAGFSGGLANLFGFPSSAKPKPNSASLTASPIGGGGGGGGGGAVSASATARRMSAMSSAVGGSSTGDGSCVGRVCSFTDEDSANAGTHLPQLAKTDSSPRYSRCGSGGGARRYPGGVCNTPAIRQKRGEAVPQLQQLQPDLSPPQLETSCSSLGDARVKSDAAATEDSMQRSYSAIEFTQGAVARAKRQASSRLLRPSMPTLSMGSDAPPAVLRAEAAVEGLHHRRVEMDGVSIFYKAARFRLLEVVPVPFNRLAAAERRLTRYEHNKLQVNSHNVALVVVLQDTQVIGTPRVYVVAAVHFIWQRVNAQLWQAHQLLCVMEELKHKYSKGYVDLVYPAGRGSVAYDGGVTQPPSIIDTPLMREGTRRYMTDDTATLQPSMPTPLPPQLPRTPSARRRSVALSRATTTATATTATTEMSDVAVDSGASSFFNVVSSERVPGRHLGTACCAAAVTCVIGGDFNSERSGPVMEYIRTGTVPGGSEVMQYWHAPQSKSPVPLDRTDERAGGGAAGRDGLATLPPTPPPLLTASVPTVCGVAVTKKREPAGSPCSHSSSSVGSPPSPTQPSMRPRRATQSPPPGSGDAASYASAAAAAAAAAVGAAGGGACLLQPFTPQQKRPRNLYSSRVSESLLSPVEAAVNPPKLRRDLPSAGTVTAAPLTPQKTHGNRSSGAALRYSHRGCTSLSTSPATSSLMDTPSRVGGQVSGCSAGGSVPTVAVTPSPHVLSALSSSLGRRGGGGGSEGQLPLPPPLLRGSKGGAAVPAVAGPAAGHTSSVSPQQSGDYMTACPTTDELHARRRTSPDIFMGVDSSPLDYSRSHSATEYASVLSTALAPGCAMRLAVHRRHDTPSLESGEAGWEDEDVHRPAPASGHATDGTTSTQASPLQDRVAGWGVSGSSGTELNLRRRHRLHDGAAAADADIVDGGGGGRRRVASLNFGSLTDEAPLSSYGDLVTPACPRSRPKRRPFASGCASDAATSSSLPQHAGRHVSSVTSPQQPVSELDFDTVSSGTSTPPPPVSLACASTLWPGPLGAAAVPPLPLIDDVTHGIRFCDAYAPYCYRHPSKVSAVNPSTNMEGKVLDHILYEDEHVLCGGVLRLGERQELPNARVPSDHYMIGSVLVPLQELHRQ
ncbi:endonuclease/exonuclease/phosphatase-like protein [Novymonas esmeraldas]|uniref:Endonuclease/exonuclease/phosphatase-like protein n=1 Tax=Novymonas esmeraldas TaxID=1808958 RepID=A0AAW0F3Y7_9TRYP